MKCRCQVTFHMNDIMAFPFEGWNAAAYEQAMSGSRERTRLRVTPCSIVPKRLSSIGVANQDGLARTYGGDGDAQERRNETASELARNRCSDTFRRPRACRGRRRRRQDGVRKPLCVVSHDRSWEERIRPVTRCRLWQKGGNSARLQVLARDGQLRAHLG